MIIFIKNALILPFLYEKLTILLIKSRRIEDLKDGAVILAVFCKVWPEVIDFFSEKWLFLPFWRLFFGVYI
jgi:hypothetical protein